ncbi:MAG: acyl carrier protein [Marinilabiliaceae bacterium]
MKEDIKGFIAETAFADPREIQEDTLLFEEGIFDSMGLLNLISFLEENYGVRTDDTDLVEDNFRNLRAIEDFVSRKKS